MNRGTRIAGAATAAVIIAGIGIYFVAPLLSDAGPATQRRAVELSSYRAGDLEVRVATVPETPRVGDNRLIVELENAQGEPQTGLDLDAYAEMPAMGAMPAMRAPADLEETAPGRYEGVMDLSMRGEWPLTVQIQNPQGADHRLQFDLATDREGLTLAAGGTPAGDAPGPSAAGPVITIDSRRRQMIGVETAPAEVRDLVRSIRAVGEVTHDQRRLSVVTLKFDGYIGELEADYVGARVEQGQVLFSVYSPELLAAQQEYLEALARAGTRAGNGEHPLLNAARQRLLLWDLPAAEVEALERRGRPAPYVPILAPRTGTVVELNIAEGGAAPAGKPLMRIVDLSRVWVDARVYEADLSVVQEGMGATVFLPYLPGRRFPAEVEYIYPFLEGRTRTARLRLTLPNEGGELKPEMYAEVALEANLEDRLSVPEEAVLIAGRTRIVFVDLGEGRLKAVRIRTGQRAQGYVEVLEGLEAGDVVVTSGNFLIAAETRLKTGIQQW